MTTTIQRIGIVGADTMGSGVAQICAVAGLQVVMEVYLAEFGDSKYRPCPLFKEMVVAGRLGHKMGCGVYAY
jgi:3-hydroxyacyl-CoA dehydrogenase